MPKDSFENILIQLNSREPHDAWDRFLHFYAALIFQVARHFESDPDRTSDCFQFICERLCEDRFRRLRRFKPDGSATFSTWLRAVVRNLCLDWRRKEFGRRRPFRSISRLSHLDQEVFRCIYQRGMSTDETVLSLQSSFSAVTARRIAESRERIEQQLTTKQRWLLGARSMKKSVSAFDGPEGLPLTIPDPGLDPEAQALLAERQGALAPALMRLSKRERLLTRADIFNSEAKVSGTAGAGQ